MRVVSQNRDYSSEFENNSYRRYENCIYLARLDSGLDINIARYKTPERAIEVFREMHDRYQEEMLNLPEADIYYMPEE
jgi:hypothetical protein